MESNKALIKALIDEIDNERFLSFLLGVIKTLVANQNSPIEHPIESQ